MFSKNSTMWAVTRVGLSAALIILVSSSQSANASYLMCSQPNAPRPFLNRPNKPYCASSRTCEQYEVDSYRRQVDAYFDELREYMRDVDEYRRDAYAYAKCMAELD